MAPCPATQDPTKIWVANVEGQTGPLLGLGREMANPVFTLPSMTLVPKLLQCWGQGRQGRDDTDQAPSTARTAQGLPSPYPKALPGYRR